MQPRDLITDTEENTIISRWLTLLIATACGLIVANIYYAQPLVGPISHSLHLSEQAAGLIVTMTQIGYGLGLLFIVPLGDLFENRKLISITIILSAMALIAAALSNQPAFFLTASLCIGLASVTVQILVPYASHLSPEATRGQVVGNVMSGLMLGIMLARPVASFVAEMTSWHAIFYLSATVMLLLAILLGNKLPQRIPNGQLSYSQLLASMHHLLLNTRILRQRSLYQACMFGAFSLFWTTTPLLLSGPDYHLSQAGIALFALAGVAGAIAAPIAGRLADKGLTQPATIGAMLIASGSFLLTHLVETGTTAGLALLVCTAILLDFGVSANVVLGQRSLFVLGAEYRSRLNGVYMALFFVGGAIGSALGGWAYANGGWQLTSWIGFALPLVALAYLLLRAMPQEKCYSASP